MFWREKRGSEEMLLYIFKWMLTIGFRTPVFWYLIPRMSKLSNLPAN